MVNKVDVLVASRRKPVVAGSDAPPPRLSRSGISVGSMVGVLAMLVAAASDVAYAGIVDSCPPSQACSDSNSGVQITLVDAMGQPTTMGQYDAVNNRTTFSWKLCRGVTPGCTCGDHEVSHVDLNLSSGICPGLTVFSASPTPTDDVDPTCFSSGTIFKWDVGFASECTDNPPTCKTYTITFNGNVPTGTVPLVIKAGSGAGSCATTTVLGPACMTCVGPTPTVTATGTRTATATATATSTATNTGTATNTATATGTATSTATNTGTATNTPTNTATVTNTPTNTATVTNTPTNTATVTNTPTNTATATNTPTNTGTATDTPITTATVTNTPTDTGTATNTPTNTATVTNTPTNTATVTNTPTNTATVTNTPTNTATVTNTPTNTGTATNTPTHTATGTNTPTNTVTATNTPTNTGTATFTPTNTATATNTPTNTGTATETRTLTPTRTLVPTRTASATATETFAEPTQEPIMAPDIALTKQFTTTCLTGNPTQFQITITNVGNVASGVVTLTDSIPQTLTLDQVIAPPGWVCGVQVPQKLTCTFAGPLGPGETAIIIVKATVAQGAVLILNEATATTPGDLNPNNDHDTATCRASATPTPALSPWGLAAAVLVLGALAALGMRRRRS